MSSFPASVVGFLTRWRSIVFPPTPTKSASPIRVGLLGASNIAPQAVIVPAKSHPEVVIAAVAARDESRAKAYAKKHGIPVVHGSYEALLADEAIDAVYIPLPNGLHFEWAIKALKANKHVLLEKPFTSNAEEARMLVQFHESLGPNRPVLLEAFHYRFHPAFNFLKALIDLRVSQGFKITHVEAESTVPAGFIAKDDIRFKFDLAGGTLMDLGTYTISCVRNMIGAEPLECTEVRHELLPQPYAEKEPKIDRATTAQYKFPDNVTAKVHADLLAPRLSVPKIRATVDFAEAQQDGQPIRRRLRMINFMVPHTWHKIVEEIEIGSKKSVKTYKAYTWKEAKAQIPELEIPGSSAASEVWWSTYRNQLEQFVDRVKQRNGNGVWISGEHSVSQMEAIDMVYRKGQLGMRSTSSHRP